MSEHATRGLTAVLYAADLARLAEFYVEAFDLVRVEETSEFVALAREDVEVVVVQNQTGVVPDGAPRIHTPIKLAFRVEDLEACATRIEIAGGRTMPIETAWTWAGASHLDGTDPEGNVVQLRMAQE